MFKLQDNLEYHVGPVNLLFIENSLYARDYAKSCRCIYSLVPIAISGHFPDEESLLYSKVTCPKHTAPEWQCGEWDQRSLVPRCVNPSQATLGVSCLPARRRRLHPSHPALHTMTCQNVTVLSV